MNKYNDDTFDLEKGSTCLDLSRCREVWKDLQRIRILSFAALMMMGLLFIFSLTACGAGEDDVENLIDLETEADQSPDEGKSSRAAGGRQDDADNESGSQVSDGDGYHRKDGAGRAGTEVDKESVQRKYIYVYLCGAVNKPGVYELPEGTRLYELINRAGGLAEDAAAEALNQAGILTDGSQIRIPSLSELDEAEAAGGSPQLIAEGGTGGGSAKGGLVNINTASATELMTLNGIGQSRAEAIIAYRDEHGGFSSIEDIKQVTGIKDGLFNKIKDQICV
ncbi:MAG: ComEA family DNA-binding protein [Lachnospiraceae bacterium]|nr:ComEA family DNA-binding protein [Lachnospiraceae bacterium]